MLAHTKQLRFPSKYEAVPKAAVQNCAAGEGSTRYTHTKCISHKFSAKAYKAPKVGTEAITHA